MTQIDPGTDGARELLQRREPLFALAIGGTGSDRTVTDIVLPSIPNTKVTGKSSSQGLNVVSEGGSQNNNALQKKLGGRFGDVFTNGEGGEYEVHHIPADSASPLPRMDGPAIKMEKADHRRTASCGNSREAREFRAMQKKLIDQGSFDAAVQMDVDDITEKFADKYDSAINEMQEYIEQLKSEGKIQ